MNDQVFKAIEDFHMLTSGDTVVVGVSGGADSMSLLHFLLTNKQKLDINIIAAHVNHCLRGEEADRDEDVVRKFCLDNKIEFELLKIDVAHEAIKRGLGLEQCGREVRYKFFDDLSRDSSYKIATAHTLSDNIETILMNITRGSGLKGLCGIPATRGKIIRPLIYVEREKIERYCEKNKIKFVTDMSNFSRDYTRNKIRLDVMPVLKEINPSCGESFRRMIENVSCDNDYLDIIAERYVNKNVDDIKKLHKSIKTRTIIKTIYEKCGVRLEKQHLDLILKMLDENSGVVNIPQDFFVTIKNGRFDVTRTVEDKKNKKTNLWQIPFDFGKIRISDKINLKFKLVCLEGNNNYENFVNLLKEKKFRFANSLDYGTISESAVIRNRRPGDFFVPVNRNVSKKLKKFFNELKIPKEKRDFVPLLADGNEVLWIDGVGVSEKCKVRRNTKNVLLIYREGDKV